MILEINVKRDVQVTGEKVSNLINIANFYYIYIFVLEFENEDLLRQVKDEISQIDSMFYFILFLIASYN